MSFEVGVDTYVTVEEADEIVTLNFIAADPVRLNWEGLDEEDKAVCLRQAFRTIEGLPFTGMRSDVTQTAAFPRHPEIEVPSEVGVAQVLIAVNFADPSLSAEMERYRRLRAAGVSSYRIGRFSEVLRRSAVAGFGLMSDEAVNLLRPWLEGGYRIL